MKPTFTPEFRSELEQAYSELRIGSFAPGFLAELKALSAELGSLQDLEWLSPRLDRWRKATQKNVETLLAKLPPDDPGLCHVSLFRPMGLSHFETAHTRTLAWLLDPTAEHGFGDQLLLALLRKYSEFDSVSVDQVSAEFGLRVPHTGESGRFDVYATGTTSRSRRWTLVIEAKVDSPEGLNQLSKYDEWLERFAENHEVIRVFLKPATHPAIPSNREWNILDFQGLVEIFRTVYPSLREKPGFDYLRYYLAGVLQDICGWRWADRKSSPYAALEYLQSAFPENDHGPVR